MPAEWIDDRRHHARRQCDLADGVVAPIGDVHVARGVDGDPGGRAKRLDAAVPSDSQGCRSRRTSTPFPAGSMTRICGVAESVDVDRRGCRRRCPTAKPNFVLTFGDRRDHAGHRHAQHEPRAPMSATYRLLSGPTAIPLRMPKPCERRRHPSGVILRIELSSRHTCFPARRPRPRKEDEARGEAARVRDPGEGIEPASVVTSPLGTRSCGSRD